MFFKKLKESPLYYWEENSVIIAITSEVDEDKILKNAMSKLTKSKEIKIVDGSPNFSSRTYNFKVKYKKKTYDINMYAGDVNIPEYYLNNMLFSEEKKVALLNAKKGITIFMKFDEEPKTCFHLQIKLAYLVMPDMLALLDESAERLFVSEWVKLTANSNFTPSSKDLYSVQAISDKDSSVWLHTHGLARCNKTELEILGSDEENSRNHYNLINSYGMYLIDKNKETDGGDYIGRLVNGMPIVVEAVPWTYALKLCKNIKNGGPRDRQNSHNSKTSAIFLYKSEENEKNHVYSKVSDFNELWGNNPLFFISDEETERMKNVAIERFDYVKKAFKNKKNVILLKIGLPLEEKGKYEHIWFELLEIKKDKFKLKLTQEPYYYKDIHEGDEGFYTLSDLTDWVIYTDKYSIIPDTAYLLD